jgi:hypothetical protein
MIRKLAGSGFAAVLLAIMALKHVALGFCLCQSQITTDPADCCAITAVEPACCCKVDQLPEEAPCKDCVIELDLEVSEFWWSTDTFAPADQLHEPVSVPSLAQWDTAVDSRLNEFDRPVRGSPPGLPPVYLRHSVLRL